MSLLVQWSSRLTAADGVLAALRLGLSGRGHLSEGRTQLAPMGFVMLCSRRPEICRATGGPREIALAPQHWSAVIRINAEVNRSIRPRHDDPRIAGGDQWSVAPAAGDCEDFALTKRQRLIAVGVPAGALRIALVRTPDRVDHAVLVVRSHRGDVVLDNLTPRIMSWDRTGYDWLALQSGADPKIWKSVANGSALALAAY